MTAATPEQMEGLSALMGQFVSYAPDFKGMISVEECIRQIRSTWEKASIEDGFGGAFVSHYGDKQWL